MKRILSYMLAAVMILCNIFVEDAYVMAAANPQIIAESVKGNAGDVVQIPVKINDNPGITAFRFIIEYDTDNLEMTGVEFKEAAQDFITGTSQNYGSPYSVSGFNSIIDADNNGMIVLFTFRINSDAEYGRYKINISYDEDDVFNMKGDNVYFDIKSGYVEVVADKTTGSTSTPEPTVVSTESPMPTPASESTVEPTELPAETPVIEPTVVSPESTAGTTIAEPTSPAMPSYVSSQRQDVNITIPIDNKSTYEQPVAEAKIVSVKNRKKKQVVIKWDKPSDIIGCEIQCSDNIKFKNAKKKITAKNKYTIKKLKKKQVYYIRLRMYKIANGAKTFGDWSKVKKIKIKK